MTWPAGLHCGRASMSCLASNLITCFAPRSNMSAPSSHGITRPLNSMIGVPALIGRAANNPTPLIGDLRLCHSRFRRCSLISSPHCLIDCILLFCQPPTALNNRLNCTPEVELISVRSNLSSERSKQTSVPERPVWLWPKRSEPKARTTSDMTNDVDSQ